MDIKISNRLKDDNIFKGKIGNYRFTAKVYDEPSAYGIKSGRVSKLELRDEHNNLLLNYDRGWDVKPSSEFKSLLKEILNFLEKLQ